MALSIGLVLSSNILQYHLYTAVNAGIVAQGSQSKLCSLAGIVCFLDELFLYYIQQRLSCLGEAAADNEDLRVYYNSNSVEAIAQDGCKFFDNFSSHFVACLVSVENIFGSNGLYAVQCGGVVIFCQSFLCQTSKTVCRSIPLQTSGTSAGTELGIFSVHGHVAKLAAGTVETCQYLAADDDAAANARAAR